MEVETRVSDIKPPAATEIAKDVQPDVLEPPTDVGGDTIAQWIEKHYTPYSGDDTFLAPPTERTEELNAQVQGLLKKELEKGILDVDVATPSAITAFAPGYINKDLEVVVGLQTDAPLKRAIKPFGTQSSIGVMFEKICVGGYRLVEKALESYGYKPDPKLRDIFDKYCKTHNDGVFDAYTKEMRAARRSHILTGLPDG